MNRMFGLAVAPLARCTKGREARNGADAKPAARVANERREIVDGVLFTAIPRYYIAACRLTAAAGRCEIPAIEGPLARFSSLE